MAALQGAETCLCMLVGAPLERRADRQRILTFARLPHRDAVNAPLG